MSRPVTPDHPVQELITRRWSPYAFADRPVAREDLLAVFEAARWAASSYNEQPWRYLVAPRHTEPAAFARLLSCLVEPNQAWARNASVLALGCVSQRFARNDKPNRAAEHDLGLAAGNICAEATARGLVVHQMIGILPDRARELFGIPEGTDALTGLAIGYEGDSAGLPDTLRQRDEATRARKPLAEFVFGDAWGVTAALVEG